MENFSFKDTTIISITELYSYLGIGKGDLKRLAKLFKLGKVNITNDKKITVFNYNEATFLKNFIEENPNYKEKIKTLQKDNLKLGHKYTAKELAKECNISRCICLRILDYLSINYTYNRKSKKVFLFDDYHVNAIKQFLIDHPDTRTFFLHDTSFKLYGAPSWIQTEEGKNSLKKSNLKKYGVENAFQRKDVKEKIKNTFLKKYGVEYYTQSDLSKKQHIATCLARYGVEHPSQTDVVKNKHKQFCLNKYGVEYFFQTEEFKEKYKQSLKEKYKEDIDNAFQAKEVKEKIKNTCLKKYGVEYASQSEQAKQKQKETFSSKTSNDYRNIAIKRYSKWTDSNGLSFDSTYEIYVYYYYMLNNVNIVRCYPLEYMDKHQQRRMYLCDFYLPETNELLETKNPAFLREDGNLHTIWTRGDNHLDESIDRSKCKLECMIKNHVTIITNINTIPAVWKTRTDIAIKDISFYEDWFEKNCKNITFTKNA